MVATGQPVSDVEDELAEVSAVLGYPDVQVAASPTGVMLNLASGAPATFESVKGGLRLDQAAEVRAIRHRLIAVDAYGAPGHRGASPAAPRPPRYPQWLANLGWIAIATGIALILQPAAPTSPSRPLGPSWWSPFSGWGSGSALSPRCYRRLRPSFWRAGSSPPPMRTCWMDRCAPCCRRSPCCCPAR